MADQVLVTPSGLHDQMYRGDGGPQRMPTPPRQANSLIVGGPAYFTPEGYQAPYQPEQSFMPTNVAPDPIRDQFNRMYPTPPPPPPPPVPAPTPAPTPAPISDPEPIIDPVVEPVVEPVVDPVIPPGTYPPYIPGLTPFPGIPGLGDLDFSGLPGMGDIDMDAIIQEYQDRIDAGEPEPFDSFLPTQPEYGQDFLFGGPADSQGSLPYPEDSNTAAPEPEFVPPPQEPNGFFPGINLEDFEDFDFGNIDFSNIDFSNLPGMMPPPVSPPAVATMPAPAPAPVYTPPPSQIPMQGMMDDYDFGNPNLRNMRGFDPRR